MTDESKWLRARLYDMACASPKPECSVPYKAMKLIEELERNINLKADFVKKTINDSAVTYQAGFEKGLDEAIAAIQESGSRNDVYSKSRTDAVKAIEALKEQIR
jgi:hypothetical protein